MWNKFITVPSCFQLSYPKNLLSNFYQNIQLRKLIDFIVSYKKKKNISWTCFFSVFKCKQHTNYVINWRFSLLNQNQKQSKINITISEIFRPWRPFLHSIHQSGANIKNYFNKKCNSKMKPYFAFEECNPKFMLVALYLSCSKILKFLVFGLPSGHPYCFLQELTSARNLQTHLCNHWLCLSVWFFEEEDACFNNLVLSCMDFYLNFTFLTYDFIVA